MKVKDHPKITGRWREYNIAFVEDWEVIWADGEDDYQGSCMYIATNASDWDKTYVMADWNWGSCSGCDGYENMDEKERILAFMNQRAYYDARSLAKWLAMYEDSNRDELISQLDERHESWETDHLGRVNAIRHALEMPAWIP